MNSPCFFKIILHNAIRDKKLALPRKFISRYGHELPTTIILKVQTGAEWRVELIKCDDSVFLQNGWPEFMEFYSIAFRSVLVFEFDRKYICFNVKIFDLSTVEIDYPTSVFELESDLEIVSEEEVNQDSDSDDDSVQIVRRIHNSPNSNSKGKSPLFARRKNLKMENDKEDFENSVPRSLGRMETKSLTRNANSC
ncbi:B3 domain-containing transcription factor VRN1-like [Mercurialis annua]|uniref:B3 domain-containing transcription factor VRN1-like n=1 Tax=Mercurialis annua TaxID=3986 RepID=UPI0024AED4F6|nr:B3 domain-containing transcription factor VRN1-like [Mercurialis annua]